MSFFCTTVPIPMWSTFFRTNWMPYSGRCFQHSPYNPDLLSCDFHICGLLRKALRFMLDDDMQEGVVQWLTQQPKEISADRILHLAHRDSCMNACGDSSWLLLYLRPWASLKCFQCFFYFNMVYCLLHYLQYNGNTTSLVHLFSIVFIFVIEISFTQRLTPQMILSW